MSVDRKLEDHADAIAQTRNLLHDQLLILEGDLYSADLDSMDAGELEALQDSLDDIRLVLKGVEEHAARGIFNVCSRGGDAEDAAGRPRESVGTSGTLATCAACYGEFHRSELLELEDSGELLCEDCFEAEPPASRYEAGDVDFLTEMSDFAQDGEFENMSADEIL